MNLSFKNNVQKIIAVVLVIATMFGLLSTGNVVTYAYTAQTGMIYSADKSMVETKKEPSASAAKANGLLYGKPVTVVDEVIGADGAIWYKLTYSLKAGGTATGYCPAKNVLLDKDVTVFANGVVNANDVKLRNDAGTDRTVILVALNKGHKVELLDTTTVDGSLWYRVRAVSNGTTYIGWMFGTYIDETLPDIEVDEEYEDYLLRIGFPESYVHDLAVLHALYPNWVFNPVDTGLDWNTVIENEAYPGRNLVENSEDDAKKSMDARAYDWSTNTWTIYDSSRWVSAHPDFIAYCMDPRNFLNATNIFMFESLNYSSIHNLEGVNAILKGTFMATPIANGDGTMLDYATAFMNIGKESNVSPYHLASRVYQEQGKGTSSLISGNYTGAGGAYKGYYNYFNIKATGSTSAAVIENGLKYAKQQGWNTRYASLLGGANFIAKSYINVGQNTLYFQKFDVIAQGGLYTHQYMQNVQAAISEGKKVAKGYADKTQAFVFNIPVYKNMPSEAVKFTASGNRNNYLSSITVSGHSLTPTFSGDKTEYSLNVENGVTSITVSAKAVVSTSTVSGTGTLTLREGLNTFKILCKSQSGETKTYTLTVNREASAVQPEEPQPDTPQPEEPQKHTWTSEKYKIETYITGVNPETSAADFIAGFKTENCTLKVLKSSGEENTGKVGTGNKLAVYANGALVETKEIVIYGDVNEDGQISMGDLVKINRHILELAKLNGIFLVAGDVNHKNDGVSMSDLVITNRHLLQLTTITQ